MNPVHGPCDGCATHEHHISRIDMCSCHAGPKMPAPHKEHNARPLFLGSFQVLMERQGLLLFEYVYDCVNKDLLS